MSQICVISNIHSNIHALKFFLEYIDKNYDVEHILNLGNFLQSGPNPCEVFDLVMNDKRFINIIGIKEFELINNDFGNGLTFDDEEMHESWSLNKLGEKRISRLKKLPSFRSIEIYGKTFFMIHLNYKTDIFSPQNNLIKIITENSLETFSKQDATLIVNENDYLLMSDDYTQAFDKHKYNNCTIVKPGAITSLNDTNINFVIIDIKENENDIIFKKIKHDSYYDVINECIENEVPDPYLGIYKNKIKKDLYTVRISPKYDTNIIPPDWSFLPKIISKLIPTVEFIKFSCWDTETHIIDEITSKFDVIDKEMMKIKDKYQIFFTVRLNNIVKNIIMNEFLCNNKIKWFSVYLYSKHNTEEPYFLCEHYGYEIFLNEMNEAEIKNLGNIINCKKLNISYF